MKNLSEHFTTVCICRLLDGPVLARYDGTNYELPDSGAEIADLTWKPDSDCRFRVQANLTPGTTQVESIRITMRLDTVVIELSSNFIVNYILPNLGAESAADASYSKVIQGDLEVKRNGNYVVVTDTVCGHSVGWDDDNPNTRAVMAVNKAFGSYLIGLCDGCY